MSDDLLRLQLVADSTEATSSFVGLDAVIDETGSKLNSLGSRGTKAGAEIAEGMEKANFSMREAKGTAMLLGEEIGVKMNRHVAGFVATLPGVGEAMSAAFSGFALIALAEIIERVTTKATDWIAKTFIMTEEMKALDEEGKKANVTIATMSEHIAAMNLEMALMKGSGSANTSLLMGIKEDEINKQAEVVRALQDQMYKLRQEGDDASTAYASLGTQLGVARKHMEELATEQGLLSEKFGEQKNKEIEEAEKKHAAAMEKIWKEQDRVDEENRKDALKRSADFLKEYEKGEKDLEKLEEHHGDLLETFNEDTGGNGYARFAADATDATNQLDQAEQRLLAHAKLVMEGLAKADSPVEAQKQIQAAMQQSETVLMRMMPTVNDLSKGWAAYAQSAIHSLEQAGVAMMEHLAIALLVSDKIRLAKAKEAATSAFAEGEKIPIVGPIMGPLLAASAYAGAMAFKQGGIVPSAQNGMLTDAYGPGEGTLSLLHPNEMVLPAPLSQTVQDMAASATGSGGGGHTFNIMAMDGADVKRVLTRHSDALGTAMHKSIDNGHFSMSKAARGK